MSNYFELTDILQAKLAEVGFEGFHPRSVLDGWFVFGDQEHIICGKVDSIGYGPDKRIVFYVSACGFRGIDVKQFERIGGAWFAVGNNRESRPGTLRFF